MKSQFGENIGDDFDDDLNKIIKSVQENCQGNLRQQQFSTTKKQFYKSIKKEISCKISVNI